MSAGSGPRVLILATSYAPELRRPELRPKQYPRTDYVELARRMDCDILDYSIYDGSRVWARCRWMEKKARLDLHLALAGYRRARRYDVVLLMSEMVAIPYMMLQKSVGRRAATVYVSAHSSQKQARLVRSLGLFRGLDIALGNSHAQRGFFVDDMLIPDERVRVVLYAADEEFFVPSAEHRADYIFSTGIANRDYATLFEAVRDLPVRVRVALGGRFYSLQMRGKAPPVPANVEVVAPTDSAGMRERYQGAAAVVVPLASDRRDATGCSVTLESMCCAKPVVASHTAGLADYIDHGRTGRLVEKGSAEALRHEIMSLVGDAGAAREIGTHARAECEGRLSLTNLVSGLASAVRDACESRG